MGVPGNGTPVPISVPGEIDGLYWLARRCVQELEKLKPKRRDTRSMHLWRDGLDHVVFLRDEPVPANRIANGRLTAEHFARIALDAAQEIAIYALSDAERREGQRWWRNLYLAYLNGAQIRGELDEISNLIVKARELKGGGDPSRWVEGIRAFLEARERALAVTYALRNCQRRIGPIAFGLMAIWQGFIVTLVIALLAHVLGVRLLGL
jgi:hypothetical protein